MNEEDILTKAIQKATANGWKPIVREGYDIEIYPEFYDPRWSINFRLSEWGEDRGLVDQLDIEAVIFSHEFAQALWPDASITVSPSNNDTEAIQNAINKISNKPFEPIHLSWQYHLQQMVIAEDPIKYLGEHL